MLLTSVAASLLMPVAALAMCPANATTVLSCTARGGARVIEMCLQNDHAYYRFGRPGQQPELEIAQSVETLGHTPWPGVSSEIWETSTFRNNGYDYEVYLSQNRQDPMSAAQAGVFVYQNGNEISRVPCDSGTVIAALFAVGDFKAAHGICWDFSTHRWHNLGRGAVCP